MTDRREHITQMSWCPTRPGLLGALFEGDRVVQLYDTRHDPGTELEAWANKPIFRRTSIRQHPPHETLTGFDWHPTVRNRLMTISNNGGLGLSTAPEQVCSSFSAADVLCCGSVGELEFFGSSTNSDVEGVKSTWWIPDAPGDELSLVNKNIHIEDISSTMRRRAIAGCVFTLTAYSPIMPPQL